jgi:hypothetical protein
MKLYKILFKLRKSQLKLKMKLTSMEDRLHTHDVCTEHSGPSFHLTPRYTFSGPFSVFDMFGVDNVKVVKYLAKVCRGNGSIRKNRQL